MGRIRLDEADGLLIFVDTVTGIFGTGRDISEAWLDFRSALDGHRRVLSGDDVLSPALRHQLEFLTTDLDGPIASAVMLFTGMTAEEIRELGGIDE